MSLTPNAETGRVDKEELCWRCHTYPPAPNDLVVCETCWEEWLTHRS
jgi:hypothetical protein